MQSQRNAPQTTVPLNSCCSPLPHPPVVCTNTSSCQQLLVAGLCNLLYTHGALVQQTAGISWENCVPGECIRGTFRGHSKCCSPTPLGRETSRGGVGEGPAICVGRVTGAASGAFPRIPLYHSPPSAAIFVGDLFPLPTFGGGLQPLFSTQSEQFGRFLRPACGCSGISVLPCAHLADVSATSGM